MAVFSATGCGADSSCLDVPDISGGGWEEQAERPTKNRTAMRATPWLQGLISFLGEEDFKKTPRPRYGIFAVWESASPFRPGFSFTASA